MEADIQGHLAEERDRNTKFFHKTANGYKRCNNIYYLLIQDELISDPLRINDEMLDFYKKIYTETVEWRPTTNFGTLQQFLRKERIFCKADFKNKKFLGV
uniref:Putative ovule protein n=1 Tax=Solanum chacoense TaxID=4108 RepID=A0A0V0GTZ1_SOLCH